MGAVRFFLALAVLQSHVYSHFLRPAQLYVNNKIVLGMNGGYAVMFFFVISGFLISFVLEEKYDRPGGTPAFYRARALRIYPLWWCLYLIVPFLTAAGLLNLVATRHVYDLLSGFFLFGSDWLLSFRDYPQAYTVPMPHGLELGWTLATEMTFYLLAPFILRSKRMPVLVLVGSIIVRIVGNRYLSDVKEPEAWSAWLYFFFPATVMFFMIGHLARQLYKSFRLPEWTAWAGLCAAAVLLCIQDGHYGFENVYFYLAIVVFSVILPPLFAATKDNKICNFLGNLTYPLYLSHSVLIVLLETDGSPLHKITEAILWLGGISIPGWNTLQTWTRAGLISLAIWCLAVTIAVIVHYVIEKPATACVRFLLDAVGLGLPSRAAVPADAGEGNGT